MGLLALFGLVSYARLQKEKAERADEHEQIAETKLEVSGKNADAIVDGQRRQQEVKNATVDTSNRDILS